MGTTFFADKMMPTYDWPENTDQRQVEVFRPSSQAYLALRIGQPKEEHSGTGVAVKLDERDSRHLLDGLLRAMHYLGFKTDDIV